MATVTINLLSALGGLVLSIMVYRTITFVLLYNRPSSLHRYLRTNSGRPAWALVTGASAGIGKALAHELAKEGFNIVLHGRNVSKLESVRAELQKVHPAREFRILVVNAASCEIEPEAWIEEVLELAQDIDLKVLINNVGGANLPTYGTLEEYDAKRILETVHLNAAFPALLTSALIPVLVRNSPGLIVNVGSLSDNGLPLLSFYSASKTFGSSLTLSVAREMELEHRDVEVMTHRVGMVAGTGDNTHVQPSFFEPSASAMARSMLDRAGCGKQSVVPYWPHGLQQAATSLWPAWLVNKIYISIMRELREDERARSKKA